MVKFRLLSRNESEVLYEYYPENAREYKPGIIELDTECFNIILVEPAERDREIIVLAEDLNSMRESINKMRIECGVLPLTEEELPIAIEDEEYYQYASHVIRKIRECYLKGEISEDGIVAWY